MPDIAVDNDGNLALDANGHLALVDGADRARQRIITSLRLWRGEWPLDTPAGVPYYQRVLGRPLLVATAAISAAVRRIPGVRAARVLDLTTTNRALEIRMAVETDHGALTLAVVV